MLSILRGGLAVFVGLVAAMVVVAVGEALGHLAYPPPPGLDIAKPETIAAYMKSMPTGAMMVVLIAWGVASLAGGWVAARIASKGKQACGMVVGVLFLAACVSNLLMIPHPAWAWLIGSVEPVPLAYLGARLAHRVDPIKPS